MTPTEPQRSHLMMMDTEHITADQWLMGAEASLGSLGPWGRAPKTCLDHMHVHRVLTGGGWVGISWPTERKQRIRGSATLRKSADREGLLFYRHPSSHADLWCYDRASFQSTTSNSGLCWVGFYPSEQAPAWVFERVSSTETLCYSITALPHSLVQRIDMIRAATNDYLH